ncbi:craniofacial development protein 2-like [Bombyx mori]|uniref:Endonuclease/exonuclease/phosphatase domain-containing protein n=1 Tax=Bombyx mori TaxID=7091 RepID=A0A8R2LYH2_BOMMO|nr:craniofacial development protein 2-like [Bombyx mori]
MGCNIEEHEDYIFCYKGETPGLYGVGFLVKKEHKNKILSFSGLSERVAMLQIKCNNTTLSIIQAYAPTERAPEEDINLFYETLETALSQAGRHVLLIGDFNAQVGQTSTNDSIVMGKFGYGKRSERGERLVQYALENKLSIMNTFFKARKNRKWTWLSPDEHTKNQVDFILSNEPKKIRKLDVLNALGFRSDHRLVRVTYMLKKEKESRTTFKSQPKPLKTEEDISCYLQNLKQNIQELNTQNDEHDVQTYYNTLENVINKSMLSKKKEPKVDTVGKILSKHTLDMLRKRTELVQKKTKN